MSKYESMPSKIQKSKHILVVEDDDIFRGALTQTLLNEGFQVTQAPHGNLAKDVIALQPIDLVISDINMPGISGLELMRYSKKLKPTLPFILMSGFAEYKTSEFLREIEGNGFLSKPFDKELLLKVIDERINPREPSVVEDKNQDLDFCKINIDDFISGKEILYDIYVRISENKFIKIAHKGENIQIERINSYKDRAVTHLYMLKEDFKKYLGFNLSLIPLVSSTKKISKEKKINFLKHTGEVILQDVFLNGIDAEAFKNAKTVVESSVSLLSEPDEMMDLLDMLNSHTDHLYTHSLGVSMYSVMVARKVKWNSPLNLYKVSMGGLLHDIGKKEIPSEILLKQRSHLTPDEVQLYESHPQRGLEILGHIQSLPSDILQIVLQHHENCLGLGFPMRLTKKHIHPMARLISVVDEFCKFVLKGPEKLNFSPKEAIQRMNTIQPGKFDMQFYTALMQIFKVDIPFVES